MIKYFNDDTIFNSINTEEKAYWLGFLLGDGHIRINICGNPSSLMLELKDTDKNHLIKFANFIKYNGNIRYVDRLDKRSNKHYYSYVLGIHSVILCKKLFDLGWNDFKIGSSKIFENIPDNLMSHFLRGWYDADGTIHRAKLGNQIMFSLINLHEELVIWYRNYLINNLPLNKAKIYKPNKAYRFTYTGNKNAKQIFDLLYKNSTIYLERKYEIYKTLI